MFRVFKSTRNDFLTCICINSEKKLECVEDTVLSGFCFGVFSVRRRSPTSLPSLSLSLPASLSLSHPHPHTSMKRETMRRMTNDKNTKEDAEYDQEEMNRRDKLELIPRGRQKESLRGGRDLKMDRRCRVH